MRVGTHGTSRTLKERLRNHYSGDREGSVFRKHLGSALLNRSGAANSSILEWRKGRKSSSWSKFENTETEVDLLLRSSFFFRVVRIEDSEERKSMEKRLIATISACQLCKPSKAWLGKFASNEKVRRSGLWNSDFIGSPVRMAEKDLLRLKQLIDTQL